MKPDRLSNIIHERVRLAVMSALAARGKITFCELKDILEVTDGNLSVHATVLEQNGLIKIKKDFLAKSPRTTFSITDKGRREFKKYIEELGTILHDRP